jgi:Fur family ferric uptake transcriptional regulator
MDRKENNKKNLKHNHAGDIYLIEFQAYLKRKKMKNTPERQAILQAICDFKTRFTIKQLHQSLEKKKFLIAQRTLYITLQMLCDAGLLRELFFPSCSTPQYEKNLNIYHHHLAFENTGKIVEISDDNIFKIIEDTEQKYNIKIKRYSFIMVADENVPPKRKYNRKKLLVSNRLKINKL